MNIDYPFKVSRRTATTGDAEHIRDMIEQLLFTSPGERVNRPRFGSGLKQLVFEPNSSEQAAVLQVATRAQIEQELGDLIELQDLSVTSEEETLRVVVGYVLRSTGQFVAATVERSGA
jgi:phage baseplate assembly protein W